MLDIKTLRSYRIKLDQGSGDGIALFDLIGTFVIAYILNYIFNLTRFVSQKVYYGSLIPLGIIVHLMIKQDTFLNSQLFNNELNVYKIVLICLIFYTFN